jgi:hypothetical protein
MLISLQQLGGPAEGEQAKGHLRCQHVQGRTHERRQCGDPHREHRQRHGREY